MSEPFTTFVESQSPATTPFTGAELLTLVQGGVSRQTPLSNIVIDAIATGTIFYVSNSGNDASTGTSATNAWKTINKVNSSIFAPGSVILFAGGQTFSGALVSPSSGTDSAPITFGSYGGGRAQINSGAATGFYSNNQSGIIVRDLICNGNGTTNNVDGVRFNNTSGNTLSDIQILNVDATNYGNNGIHVTATAGGAGYRRITLRGCLAQGCNFQPDSSGLLIDGRTMGLAGIYVDAPSAYGTGYSGTTGHYDVLIENCLAILNLGTSSVLQTTWSGSGIVVAETNTGLVIGCQAISNGGNDNGGNIAIWTYDSSNVVIDTCRSISQRTGGNGDGGGYDIDGGCRNCTIQNCFSRDNAGEGYLLDSYTDSAIPAGHWSDNSLIGCVSISDGSGGGGNGSRCSFQVYLNDVSAGMTNLTISNCTGYQTNGGVPVLFLDANPTTNLNTATLTGRIVGNNFANNGALDWVKSTGNPTSIIISNNNISAVNDYNAHWNGVHYTTPAALSAAVPNVGQGGIMPLFIETGTVIVSNASAQIEVQDTSTNGGDWFLQATINGTTPYFNLFENNGFKTEWASNFDGAGSFGLRAGGTFAWTSDADFADDTADTGISRGGAGIIAFGNGTAGDTSASLQCGELITLTGNTTFTSTVNAIKSTYRYNNSLDLGGVFGSGTAPNITFNLNGGFGGGTMTTIASYNIFNTGDIGFLFQPPSSGGTVFEDTNNGLYFSTVLGGGGGGSPIFFAPGRTIRAKITPTGSFILQVNGALAANATDGFTYIPTCAGPPTGTPTTQTGAVPLVYDTSNNQLWVYNGSWLQPKTPAAAAIVHWQ